MVSRRRGFQGNGPADRVSEETQRRTHREDNMDITVIRAFFMWCTILNAGLLCLSFLICAFAGDWVYRMHGRWFSMPRQTFNVVLYSFLGAYKIAVWVFSAVPYVALVIVG
jgi:hypothetical protein